MGGELGRRVRGEANWMSGELKWRGPVGMGGELKEREAAKRELEMMVGEPECWGTRAEGSCRGM